MASLRRDPDAAPSTGGDRHLGRGLLGAAAGLLAGTAAVAASEAVTALLAGVSSPLLSVANRAVDAAPRPLKEFAISTFGTADKPVLIGGVIATVALMAMAIGYIGLRLPRVAFAAFVLLSLVSTVAALTDRSATAGAGIRLLPAVTLLVVGLVALLLLLRPLRTPASSEEPGGAHAAASDSAAEPEPQLERREVLDNGKHRMIVGDVLPARVDGDRLPAAFDRRAFLQTAVAVGAVAGAGGLVARQFGGAAATAGRAELSLPVPQVKAPPLPEGATLDVPGITPYLTPNREFYRVDTALRVPDVPIEGWTLRIHGMVDQELELSFEDLLQRRLVESRITLTCVSNEVGGEYVGNATWIGVPMKDLLEEAGIQGGADAILSTSADDFTAGTPLPVLLDEQRGALVAIAMNGEPLPLDHGFPARMVTPGLYGYVSATKWLVDLEVSRFADFKAYWTTRGYSAEAPIKTSSRIDVPRSFERVKAGRTAVAGVAWSQDRGIERVEVRVDDEAWQQADLATEDNINCWRQWVYRWDAEPGSHRIEVRATDKAGNTQTSEREPIAPDGSTGWHNVNVTVV
ncbi:MAG: molybdopterin-dependent oxidoreductase [Nocardioides sp.]